MTSQLVPIQRGGPIVLAMAPDDPYVRTASIQSHA